MPSRRGPISRIIPKAAVWPDAYYISTREFAADRRPIRGRGSVCAESRPGHGRQSRCADHLVSRATHPLYNLGDGLLPSDLDGPTLPPAGQPNFFVGSQDNNGPYGAPSGCAEPVEVPRRFRDSAQFQLRADEYHSRRFVQLHPGSLWRHSCLHSATGHHHKIDHLGYRQRPLFRLAYRNFGDHESLVTNQSVSGGTGPNGEVSGIRWWEIRNPNSSPVIFQEGTYAPGITDGIHRWMGSIAMDGQGNMALGYSASNGTNPSVFPSVFYTGRMAGDPLGMMTLGEASIINGTGSQTATLNRWGDYTSLTVDPTDDLTFWHVNEWVPTTSSWVAIARRQLQAIAVGSL